MAGRYSRGQNCSNKKQALKPVKPELALTAISTMSPRQRLEIPVLLMLPWLLAFALSVTGTCDATAEAAEMKRIMIPVTLPGDDDLNRAERWLDQLLAEAKNKSTVDPLLTKPFYLLLQSDRWMISDFQANFSGGTAHGFASVSRRSECIFNPDISPAYFGCPLTLDSIQTIIKAQVKGDIPVIPMEHPIATYSSFSGGSATAHLKRIDGDSQSSQSRATFTLQNITLTDAPAVKTAITGTLSLNSKRLASFRARLAESLVTILRDELLPNYAKILTVISQNSPSESG